MKNNCTTRSYLSALLFLIALFQGSLLKASIPLIDELDSSFSGSSATISGEHSVSALSGQGWLLLNSNEWQIATDISGDSYADRKKVNATIKKPIFYVVDLAGVSIREKIGLVFSLSCYEENTWNDFSATVYGIRDGLQKIDFSEVTMVDGVEYWKFPSGLSEVVGELNCHLQSQQFENLSHYLPISFGSVDYDYLVISLSSKRDWEEGAYVRVDDVQFRHQSPVEDAAADFPHFMDYANMDAVEDPAERLRIEGRLRELWRKYTANFLKNAGDMGESALMPGEWRADWPNKLLPTGRQSVTVSEGVAYAMLLCTLMVDDYSSEDAFNTKPIFDGLFSFYQRRLNDNGLMKWQVLPDESIDSIQATSDATDADMDVAMALILAHAQWGSKDGIPYLDQAKVIINRLEWKVCRSNDYDLFQHDSMTNFPNEIQNISYYAPAWYRVFAEVTGNDYWDEVAHNCMNEIKQFYLNVDDGAQGLVPDWHDPRVIRDGAGDYLNEKWAYTSDAHDKIDDHITNRIFVHGFDACRVGWRIGQDYAWDENATSTSFSAQFTRALSSFMWDVGWKGNNWKPTRIRTYDIPDGILARDDGTIRAGNKASLSGPVGVAAMMHQDNSDYRKIYSNTLNYLLDDVGAITGEPGHSEDDGYAGDEAYFAANIQLLSALTMTGNFPDLSKVAVATEVLELENPSFETPPNASDDWNRMDWHYTRHDLSGGVDNSACLAMIAKDEAPIKGQSVKVKQTVDEIVGGAFYNVGVSFKRGSLGHSEAKQKIILKWRDSSGTPITGERPDGSPMSESKFTLPAYSDTNIWKEFQISVTAPADAARVLFFLTAESGVTGECYFDDVILELVESVL